MVMEGRYFQVKSKHWYSHFPKEEIEVYRNYIICSRAQLVSERARAQTQVDITHSLFPGSVSYTVFQLCHNLFSVCLFPEGRTFVFPLSSLPWASNK